MKHKMRFMAFIVCARCGKRLTAAIAETALPRQPPKRRGAPTSPCQPG